MLLAVKEFFIGLMVSLNIMTPEEEVVIPKEVEIIYDTQFEAEERENMKEFLSGLPEEYLNDYIYNDGIIYVSDGDIASKYDLETDGCDGLQGKFTPEHNKFEIYFDTDCLTKELFYHEFGHFVCFDIFSRDEEKLDEYTKIYELEKFNFTQINSNMLTSDDANYFVEDEKEFFAETFSLYLTNPEFMKEYFPNTYNYYKVLGI